MKKTYILNIYFKKILITSPKGYMIENERMIYDDKICRDIFHEWKGAIGGGQDAILKNINGGKK